MVLSLLFAWRRVKRRADLNLVLYTRAGCHLCETARQILDEAHHRYGFALEAIDIDASSDLAKRYGECVPVVTVNGKLRFRGAVNPVLLRRILDAKPETE
jgi:glutaredoxin